MSRKSRPAPPTLPGIDLAFRPTTYFWPLPMETHLLARIKGAQRKAELKHMIASGKTGDIPDIHARSSLSDAERVSRGRIHPSMMGGEYLPDLGPKEVEIARITIASVTRDVTSVYARRGKNRIYYRVVDDYEGGTVTGKSTRTSRQPLTLGQLEKFFNGAWSIFEVLDCNFAEDRYNFRKIQAFVECVESAFYPQIGDLYAQRIARWVLAQQAALPPDEKEEATPQAQGNVVRLPKRR